MINRLKPDFTNVPGRRVVPRMYGRKAMESLHVDVSVITPYYNTDEFIGETFISLLAQSLQNWEWVIVDDGSTNQQAIDALRNLAGKDDRISVIRQANAGPGAARNAGVRHANGRYVCLLDHDDMLEPTFLEKCAWFLDSHQEFAFCNSYYVIFGELERLGTVGYERGRHYLKANSAPPISVIRRSAFLDCGGFDESVRDLYEDWDFWLAMANAGHWGYTIPEFLEWYRKRGNGRYEETLKSGHRLEDFAKVMQKKYPNLEAQFPEPSLRYLQPYETLTEESLVCNTLSVNTLGRRVLFIIPWMVTGGADRVNLDLIEGLTSRNHQVTICATLRADHQWEDQFSRFTPDIFVLPNILCAADYPKFLAYMIRSRHIDTVVVTGSTIGYQLLPYLRSVSPDVAFVDMCHVEEPHWLNGGHPRFGVGYQEVLDLNIVTTKHLAGWMEDRGADGSRLRVMYTGVRPPTIVRAEGMRELVREELRISPGVPTIIFAGRLCAQKRPAMLAEILKIVHHSGVKFRALIVGDGELRGEVERLLRQYNLNTDVQLIGTVSHQRWLDLLSISDLLLMPSQYEGISVALLEAMAAGVVPVVASVGGQKELVSPDAGILISQGANEREAYAAALCRLLSNPGELQQMSNRCRAIATSQVSWNDMIDHFDAFLHEAHQLRLEKPRVSLSRGLGRELASLSLEYHRVGEAGCWPWEGTSHSLAGMTVIPTSAEERRVARYAIQFSRTSLGCMMIRNPYLKAIGRWLTKIMTARRTA